MARRRNKYWEMLSQPGFECCDGELSTEQQGNMAMAEAVGPSQWCSRRILGIFVRTPEFSFAIPIYWGVRYFSCRFKVLFVSVGAENKYEVFRVGWPCGLGRSIFLFFVGVVFSPSAVGLSNREAFPWRIVD